MALTHMLRNFVLFVDGFGKVGDGTECTLPKITDKVEEYRGGGMYRGLEIALGGEKLEATFKMTSFDPHVIGLIGPAPGKELSYVFRGAVANVDGTTNRVMARMLARIKDGDFGTWTVGTKNELTFTLSASRYTLMHGDIELVHIDVQNFIERRNGVNILDEQRIALGI